MQIRHHLKVQAFMFSAGPDDVMSAMAADLLDLDVNGGNFMDQVRALPNASRDELLKNQQGTYRAYMRQEVRDIVAARKAASQGKVSWCPAGLY